MHMLVSASKARWWTWSVSADALHWLVIPQRVQYKLAVTVHCCLWHGAPRYLADYCVPVSEVAGRQQLRCARCHQLSVPRVRYSTYGTRAFSVARSRVWNSLSEICRIQLLTPNNLGETWRQVAEITQILYKYDDLKTQ